MKRTLFVLILIGFTFNMGATKHIVTLSTDNESSPIDGMFRYFIENAANGDTIIFDVNHVDLEAEIRIAYKSIVILGGEGVIIDGGQNGRVFNISFDSTKSIIIKNITIQNGLINSDDYSWGGGMYTSGSGDGTGLVVENCTFKNNTANTNSGDGQGGALRTQKGLYKNCCFLNNAVTGTGSSNSGGAIMSVGGKFINCVFAGNSAKYGGGIYATNSSEFTNCTVTQNQSISAGNGAGIGCEGASVFTNCIVYNNKSAGVDDNVNNSACTFSYSALEMGNALVGTANNIGLTETPFIHTGVDSLSLKETSACIDVGNSSISNLPEKDILGNDRIRSGVIDMGAYEFFVPIIINASISTEEGSILGNYDLHDNITVAADGSFSIEEGVEGISKDDTLVFKAAPNGYEFYPKKIIVDQAKTINIIAYKGIVVDEAYPVESTISWVADTVNVFTDVILDSTALTISPNTKVKFYNWNAIRLSGTGHIVARGTKDQPILFTPADTTGYTIESYSNVTGAWHGIRFANMTSADSSIFEFCTLQYGKGSRRGGGSYASQFGGAISVFTPYYASENRYDKLKLINCNISNNCSYGSDAKGGGISLIEANATLINCNISNNALAGVNIYGGSGGAIHMYSSTVNLINCNIVNNKIITDDTFYGGAGICSGDSRDKITMYNCILRDNHTGIIEDQLVNKDEATINIYNCNIQNGNTFSASIYKKCIDTDPLFTDAEIQDYSLQASSPCINLGTTDGIVNKITEQDINGNNRIYQTYIDIGINEYQQDIITEISGYIKYEDGSPLSNHVLFPNITTDATGYFTITAGGNGISEGDTLALESPVGFGIYPSHIIVGLNQLKSYKLTAYNGIVVDEYTTFNNPTIWNENVNVFTDVVVNNYSLNITGGTQIKFHKYSGLSIIETGSIVALGLKNDSVYFTSSNPEYFTKEGSSTKGAWKGIKIYNMSANADSSIFKYCKIEFGKNFNKGGALYTYHFNKIKIENCEISNNTSDFGGGLYLSHSDISIVNCNIHDNYGITSGGWGPSLCGGGVYIHYSNAKLIGCSINNNSAKSYDGGGVFSFESSVIIANCNIVNNSHGGIFAHASDLKITNSIIWGNSNYQMDINSYGTVSTAELYSSCIQGGNTFSAGIFENCIETDPSFEDDANNNYKLQASSHCINIGAIETISTILPNRDIADNIRIMGDTIDIGAYEFEETTLFIQASNEGAIETNVLFEAMVFMGTASSWSWDFNGDNVEDANIQNPNYSFTQSGVYTVRLIANINETGTIDTAYHTINIFVSPAANFSADNTIGANPFTVQFIDESSNSPVSWLWDFGDGSTSTKQNPSNTYLSAGIYTVKLTAINIAGSTDEIKTDYITVYIMPVAEFSVDKTEGKTPLVVQFTDVSSNNPTSWLWNFGDGNTSAEQNPSNTYSYAGAYTVKLTASNIAGSTDEIKTNYITVSNNTSVNSPEKNKIIISPNPAKSFISILSEKQYEIKLLDISGNLLMKKSMKGISTTIDIRDYPRGVLILHLLNDNEIIVKKIIIE